MTTTDAHQPARRVMSATPERLAWLREQLGGQIAEAPVAGEIFRPRGAWGDRPARLRRFVFRRLGMGRGLHGLERGMGVLNLAVATQSRLHLFALRGRRGGIDVGDELVSWPLPGLELKTERRSVEATRFSGDAYTRHKSKILSSSASSRRASLRFGSTLPPAATRVRSS